MRHKSKALFGMAAAALWLAATSRGQAPPEPQNLNSAEKKTLELRPGLAVAALESNPTFSFGMIGLGTTATARLNVVNVVRTPPPILIAQVPCKVELDLYDDQNNLLKQKVIPDLAYGHADFVELARSELSTSGTNVEVSGVIKVASNQVVFCNVVATMEVFDNVTGATTAILATAH